MLFSAGGPKYQALSKRSKDKHHLVMNATKGFKNIEYDFYTHYVLFPSISFAVIFNIYLNINKCPCAQKSVIGFNILISYCSSLGT